MKATNNRTNRTQDPAVLPFRTVRFAEEVGRERVRVPETAPLIVRRDDASQIPFADWIYESADFYSVAITLRGTATQVSNDSRCEASRGDVYVVPLGCRYGSLNAENYLSYSAIFTMNLLDAVTSSEMRAVPGFYPFFLTGAMSVSGASGGRLLHLGPAEFEGVERLCASMHAEYLRDTPDGRLMARLRFLELLVTLARIYASRTAGRQVSAGNEPRHGSTISAAVSFLDEHFRENVHIGAVAASCFLSTHAFGKYFLDQVGQTPREYLTYLRIEHAKRLLLNTGHSVAEVGWQSGYQDPAYFVRAFRQATGMPPGQYRATQKSGAGPGS